MLGARHNPTLRMLLTAVLNLDPRLVAASTTLTSLQTQMNAEVANRVAGDAAITAAGVPYDLGGSLTEGIQFASQTPACTTGGSIADQQRDPLRWLHGDGRGGGLHGGCEHIGAGDHAEPDDRGERRVVVLEQTALVPDPDSSRCDRGRGSAST